jgi:hypothetical protein
MSFCAFSGSFQSSGLSTSALSSLSLRVAVSTSKMPPQQSNGLLGGFGEAFNFSAHNGKDFPKKMSGEE